MLVLDLLAFILAAVAVIVAMEFLADRTGLPAAALFTVAGLIYALLPGPIGLVLATAVATGVGMDLFVPG